MRTVLTLAITAALSAVAAAQTSSGGLTGYRYLEVVQCEEFSVILNGQLEYLKGGVQIRLIPEDPTLEPLPLKCRDMYFEYAPDSPANSPSRVRLEGDVDVTHPDGRVRAGRAVWDFSTNQLVFEGDPVVDAEGLKDGRAERISIDFNTNRLVMSGRASVTFDLGAKKEDPSELKAEDIKDWTAFLTKLQTQAKAEANSPGKHLVGMLDANYQASIRSVPVATLVQNKSDLTGLLNNVLKQQAFYDAAAWQGVAIPDEAKTLLAQPNLSADGRTRCNRLLLEAAFPEAF